MKLAIASGKGGTGKTTLAVSLAKAFSGDQFGFSVSLGDCDVEEPNCHLFAGVEFDCEAPGMADFVAYQPDDSRDCGDCNRCADSCRFNAVAVVKSKPIFFPELCHGCGACEIACPAGWIKPAKRRTGLVRSGKNQCLDFTDGLLDVGVAMATSLIDHVKNRSAKADADINILDCPPGTSCAMIEAVKDADFALLITEPTPFGLHDLKRAVAVARDISIKFAIVVNRDDGRDKRVHQYCQEEGIELIASIADSRNVARNYCRGDIPYGRDVEFTEAVDSLVLKIRERFQL